MREDLEQVKHQYEINQEHAKRAHDLNRQDSAEFRKAAVESANLAIRSMVLVNGGAVVALLAFVGAIASKDFGYVPKVDDLVTPIWWFALGVGLSSILAALAYLVNMLDADITNSVNFTWKHPYVEDTSSALRLRGFRTIIHVSALIIAVATLCVFFRGILGVTDAITGMGL